MAVVVQAGQNAVSSTTSITVTMGAATTTGNALVAMVLTVGTNDNGSVSGITLGGSADHWASEATVGTTTSHAIASAWSDPSCAGGQTSVVISTSGVITGTQIILAWVYEVSGMPTTGPLLDQSATVSSSGFVSSWTLGPTSTTTQASEVWFVIAGGNVNSASPGTFTGPSSPWVNESSQGIGGSFSPSAISGYQIASSTGTASYSGSVTPTSTIEGLVVTLKASSGITGSGSVAAASWATSGNGAGGNITSSGTVGAPSRILSGSGTSGYIGSGSAAEAAWTISGTAAEAFTCTGSVAAASPAATGSGYLPTASSGSIAAASYATSGSGGAATFLTGTGSAGAAVYTLSGTGVLTFTGSGTLAANSLTLSGAGVMAISGTGSAGVAAYAINASGSQGQPVTSSGSLMLASYAISASGNEGNQGSNLLMLGFI